MLEIRKSAVTFDGEEMLELERILIAQDEIGAFRFLRKSVYNKIARSQHGKLKSHMDAGGDPAERFKQRY
ncbi:MAG: hypothetical protein WC749_08960 [Dehalococcoidia bacterium]